jgi:hypothetical protein
VTLTLPVFAMRPMSLRARSIVQTRNPRVVVFGFELGESGLKPLLPTAIVKDVDSALASGQLSNRLGPFLAAGAKEGDWIREVQR